MFNLLWLASLAGTAADIDLTALEPRAVVQLLLQDDSSVLSGVVEATAETVEVMNLETQTAQTFSRADLKAIRSDLSERQIVDKVGTGRYAAWQIAPIFENDSRRQTTASIQQAAVYVTANRWSGLMVGDEVFVRASCALLAPADLASVEPWFGNQNTNRQRASAASGWKPEAAEARC